MPLVTNSAGRKLYVLRRISTGEILKRNTLYANAVDDSPISGLDPDLEYLAIDRDAEPDYDSRLYSLTKQEAKEGNLWRETWTTPKRSLSERKAAAANVEAFENQKHYTPAERDKLLFLGLGVVLSQIANQELTPKQVAIKNRCIGMQSKLLKNDKRLADLITAIEAEQDPDLDAGWEAPA